jgi:hypothetical protein
MATSSSKQRGYTRRRTPYPASIRPFHGADGGVISNLEKPFQEGPLCPYLLKTALTGGPEGGSQTLPNWPRPYLPGARCLSAGRLLSLVMLGLLRGLLNLSAADLAHRPLGNVAGHLTRRAGLAPMGGAARRRCVPRDAAELVAQRGQTVAVRGGLPAERL